MKLKDLLNSAKDISTKAPKGEESDITVNGIPLSITLDVIEQNGDSWVNMGFSTGSLTQDIISNSKPMPAEFAQLVNENFWDLVD